MIKCPENVVFGLKDVRLELDEGAHPWIVAEKAAIDAYWVREQVERPWLYNGVVMLHRDFKLEGGVISGVSHCAPYAGLQYLLRTQPENTAAFHLFGYAVILSSDNAVLLVRMAARTAIAGKIVAPAGSLDQSDIKGRKVDVKGGLVREAREETGLDLSEAVAEDLLYCYRYGNRLAVGRRFQFDQPAARLVERVREHIRTDPEEEIDDVVVVRKSDDIGAATLPYVEAIVDFHFTNPEFATAWQMDQMG